MEMHRKILINMQSRVGNRLYRLPTRNMVRISGQAKRCLPTLLGYCRIIQRNEGYNYSFNHGWGQNPPCGRAHFNPVMNDGVSRGKT